MALRAVWRCTALRLGCVLAISLAVASASAATAAPAADAAAPGADSPSADSPSAALPSTALSRYLDGLQSLRTDFSQTVTDAQGHETESGTGTLLVQRPGRFRWDYTLKDAAGDSGGQLLVADGTNLWFYDRELAQVTVKPVQAALSSTPMMLLSGSTAQLRSNFDIRAGGDHDGLSWVSIKPLATSADFARAQLGFAAGAAAAHGDRGQARPDRTAELFTCRAQWAHR